MYQAFARRHASVSQPPAMVAPGQRTSEDDGTTNIEGGAEMPAKTEKQRKFMGAELARKRAGKKTKTGMSEKKLEEFAKKK